MKLEVGAFAQVPQLRDKILDPASSRFRDLDYAELDAYAFANGFGADWRRSDTEREATRDAFLKDKHGSDLWVFAYGSLMWDPAFYFDEVRIARAYGFQRRFCLEMKTGRGSSDEPGLMAALDRGASCEGLAFRIRADLVDQETEIIWRREMIAFGYTPTMISLETDAGTIAALGFVADPENDRYVSELDTDRAARMIASAKGVLGTNIGYLDSLAEQLSLLGLEDVGFDILYDRARKLAES